MPHLLCPLLCLHLGQALLALCGGSHSLANAGSKEGLATLMTQEPVRAYTSVCMYVCVYVRVRVYECECNSVFKHTIIKMQVVQRD